MSLSPRSLLAAAAVTAVAPCLVAVPAHAVAPTSCLGRAVTVVASSTVTEGTEGDDVVAVEPGAWTDFDAKGGNDTICLDVPAEIVTDHYGGRSRLAILDAGAGDDTVVNLVPAGTTGITTTVTLGLGSDTFTGADIGEQVFAETVAYDPDAVATDARLTGAQRDVVTGAAQVWSTAPLDGPNADRITFGTRGARAVIDGPMSADGLVDVSASEEATLALPSPDRLRSVPYGGVLVDNRARRVVAGSPTVSWVGDVQTFEIGTPTRSLGAYVSFVGSDLAETVRYTDANVGDVDLGGGDDTLAVQGLNLPTQPASALGGAGRDTAHLEMLCRRSIVVRLDDATSCDGRTGDFSRFEEVIASSGASPEPATTLVGTGRGDTLRAFGSKAVVRGRGGDDVIDATAPFVRVRAGAGADRVSAIGLDAVVRGEAGPDRIRMPADGGVFEGDTPRRQRVALGGPGADVLVGASDPRPDRLVGGAGKDRADGGKGRRDVCTAEVTRRCERP
ncbi:hypothetical protein [Nocardioides zeicaulis]|uniref:Calcium-binding protein n=1 Tax=Nocardioides zeicaulis TaxID=1776857 RepID=A0ABV6E6H2_9ACTN